MFGGSAVAWLAEASIIVTLSVLLVEGVKQGGANLGTAHV